MADRPSVKDILAAARQGSPAPTPGPNPPAAPKAGSNPAEAAPSASSGRPLTVQEKLAAARAGKVEVPKVAPVAPTASAAPEVLETPKEGFASVAAIESVVAAPASDRPLSIKEKLAAARTGGTASPSTSSKPAAVPTAVSSEAAADRPLSIKDKLAAAKTGAGGPAAIKSAAPKVPKPANPAVATPSKSGPRDPKVLAGALREAAEAKEKAPPAPVAVVQPVAATKSRGSRLLVAGVVVATLLGGLTWMVRKVAAEPPIRIKVGQASGFGADAVKVAPEWDFAVVRRPGRIVAIRLACTHLGCPTAWVAAESKFRSPCHGSAFDAEGVNVEGPAPRPLERYKVSLSSDGQVVVDRSRTFRKELGEWDDPASFVNAG